MLLENLEQMFFETDNEGKKMILGSLFTEKLHFGNEMCRTTEVNMVIRILTKNSKCLKGAKKGKAVIFDSFSFYVPTKVVLSNRLIQDIRLLANVYRHLLKTQKVWLLFIYIIF